MMGLPRPAPQPERADHAYIATIGNACASCGKANWPYHDQRVVPDANGCIYNHEALVTNLIVIGGEQQWRRCPSCHILVEQHYPSTGAVGNQWGPGRGSLTGRQQDRLKAWLGWWKFNGGDE